MKKLIAIAAAGLLIPGAAYAAEPAAEPTKCCCEKMKEADKECCAKEDKSEHEGHEGHDTAAPNT